MEYISNMTGGPVYATEGTKHSPACNDADYEDEDWMESLWLAGEADRIDESGWLQQRLTNKATNREE